MDDHEPMLNESLQKGMWTVQVLKTWRLCCMHHDCRGFSGSLILRHYGQDTTRASEESSDVPHSSQN